MSERLELAGKNVNAVTGLKDGLTGGFIAPFDRLTAEERPLTAPHSPVTAPSLLCERLSAGTWPHFYHQNVSVPFDEEEGFDTLATSPCGESNYEQPPIAVLMGMFL